MGDFLTGEPPCPQSFPRHGCGGRPRIFGILRNVTCSAQPQDAEGRSHRQLLFLFLGARRKVWICSTRVDDIFVRLRPLAATKRNIGNKPTAKQRKGGTVGFTSWPLFTQIIALVGPSPQRDKVDNGSPHWPSARAVTCSRPPLFLPGGGQKKKIQRKLERFPS